MQYKWADGTYGTKVISWTIKQAEQNLTLSPTSVSTFGTGKFTVSGATGSVTYTSSKPDVLKINADGTYEVLGEGAVTVTVTAAGDANYATATKQFAVNAVMQDGFRVDGKVFRTLKEAVTYAESLDGAQTITVKGNPVINETVTIGKNITISVENGATLTRGEKFLGTLISVAQGGTLNIQNVTLDGNRDKIGDNPAQGSMIEVGQGGVLNVGNGAVMTNAYNQGGNGGAIILNGGNLTVSGGTISNNGAGGVGNGVYVADGSTVTVAGNELQNVTDAFGIAGKGQIKVEGSIESTVNVEFASPAEQYGEVYVTSDDNSGQELKDHFLVTNPGYTFSPVEPTGDATNGALELAESQAIVAVIEHTDGTYSHYTSIQAAIDDATDGETVLLATYKNEDTGLSSDGVTLNDTLVFPSGKGISFGSVHVTVKNDTEGDFTAILQIWIFIAGPLAGAALAALLYRFFESKKQASAQENAE